MALPAASAVLAAPERFPRAIFLMSDDGYANTATVAAGILEELKLPWTLFVSTRHIGGAVPNPIFVARLFFFFAPDGVYRLPHLGQPVSLGTPQTRAAMADGLIDRLRHLPAGQAEESLAAMRAALGEARLTDLIGRFASERFLTWDGVRALKARGVEIGAHADSLWPMHKDQSSDWLHRQACVSRAQIEAAVAPCRFFAYPFGNIGDVGPGAWRAVRDAGFTHAFTTLSGSLAAGGNPMLLPRYGIGPKDTHIASLVPLLRVGNGRLRHWQDTLADDPAMGTSQG